MLNARRIPLARGKLQMDYPLLSHARVRDVRGSVLFRRIVTFIYSVGCVLVSSNMMSFDVILFFVPYNSVTELMKFLVGCAEGVRRKSLKLTSFI